MKKIILISIIILFCSLIAKCMMTPTEELLPESVIGKDTHAYFGKGRYQIFSTSGKNRFGIFMPSAINTIENEVYRYKKIEDKVYIFGIKGYTLLSISKNEIKHYQYDFKEKDNIDDYEKKAIADLKISLIFLKSYNEFSDEDKKIFDRLKNHKWYDFFW